MLNLFKKKESNIDFLVVGLGNPTLKYEKTRHNVGFMALDFIAKKYDFKIDRVKFNSLTADVTIEGKRCFFIKPNTYMNNSGIAVAQCAKFYKIPIENIIIIFDDISLPVGKLRTRKNGSAGGHNGIKSIIEHLSSEGFPRIKIGVGQKPHKDYDLANWVLSSFDEMDNKIIQNCFDDMLELLKQLIK